MSLVCVADFEKRASELIPKNALDYYRSGAGDEHTLKLNKKCFEKLRIRPRCLRDVSNRTTTCQVLGIDLQLPVGISPTAMQKMAHPEGERANARAVGNAGSIFILSTIATSSIEEIAEAAPDTNKWFQLYIYNDRELTKSLIHRAEAAGFKALVLTVDTPLFGIRRADVRNKFTLPEHLGLANFVGEKKDGVVSLKGGSGLNEYVDGKFDATLTWKDVAWLVKFTKLPVILKGILTKEDALLAIEYGCKGIIVSNHGARQVDGVPATIEALPEIVKAVNEKIVVMLDGGITQGTDVLKALALGAKMVFMGRPALWGLAVDGQKGVETILSIVKHELDIAMACVGCKNIKDISSDLVVHEMYYSKL